MLLTFVKNVDISGRVVVCVIGEFGDVNSFGFSVKFLPLLSSFYCGCSPYDLRLALHSAGLEYAWMRLVAERLFYLNI